MKKKILLFFCSIFILNIIGTKNTLHTNYKKNRYIPGKPDLPTIEKVEIIDLGDQPVLQDDMKDYSNCYHPLLGKIKAACNTQISQISLKTYQSGFNKNDNKFELYDDYFCDTYFFENPIDVPLENGDITRLNPYESTNFIITNRVERTEQFSVTYQNAKTYLDGTSVTHTISLGIKAKIDVAKVGELTPNGSVSGSRTHYTEDSTYDSITTAYSRSTKFGKEVTRSYELCNNTENPKEYKACYRQQFKLGFITSYKVKYKTIEKKCGLFGKDTKYSYEEESYVPQGIYAILIPQYDTYFTISEYIVTNDGKREYLKKDNTKIVYF